MITVEPQISKKLIQAHLKTIPKNNNQNKKLNKKAKKPSIFDPIPIINKSDIDKSEAPKIDLKTIKDMYLKEIYSKITSQYQYTLVQHNGHSIAEYSLLKTKLQEKNMVIARPPTHIIKKVVRPDLSRMCVGTISLIYSRCDPDIKYVFDLCEASQGKMLVLGGYAYGSSFTVDGLKDIMHLPSMSVLQGQLVGLLESQLRSVVSTLERVPNEIVDVLKRREL